MIYLLLSPFAALAIGILYRFIKRENIEYNQAREQLKAIQKENETNYAREWQKKYESLRD